MAQDPSAVDQVTLAKTCQFCHVVLSSAQKRAQHEASKHNFPPGQRRFACEYCRYTYSREDYLLFHIRTKHQGITLECPHCFKTFARDDRYEKHLRDYHNVIHKPQPVPMMPPPTSFNQEVRRMSTASFSDEEKEFLAEVLKEEACFGTVNIG